MMFAENLILKNHPLCRPKPNRWHQILRKKAQHFCLKIGDALF